MNTSVSCGSIFMTQIDLLYNNYSDNGQSKLLQAFRLSLQKTYPTTSISGDGQVAVINFTVCIYSIGGDVVN